MARIQQPYFKHSMPANGSEGKFSHRLDICPVSRQSAFEPATERSAIPTFTPLNTPPIGETLYEIETAKKHDCEECSLFWPMSQDRLRPIRRCSCESSAGKVTTFGIAVIHRALPSSLSGGKAIQPISTTVATVGSHHIRYSWSGSTSTRGLTRRRELHCKRSERCSKVETHVSFPFHT